MMKEELVIIQISHGFLLRTKHLMGGGISRIEGTEEILYVNIMHHITYIDDKMSNMQNKV